MSKAEDILEEFEIAEVDNWNSLYGKQTVLDFAKRLVEITWFAAMEAASDISQGFIPEHDRESFIKNLFEDEK